jgi:hypothetical protein
MGSRHAEITGQPHKRSCGLDIYSPSFAQCRESDRRHVVVAHAIDYGEVAYLRGPPHPTASHSTNVLCQLGKRSFTRLGDDFQNVLWRSAR